VAAIPRVRVSIHHMPKSTSHRLGCCGRRWHPWRSREAVLHQEIFVDVGSDYGKLDHRGRAIFRIPDGDVSLPATTVGVDQPRVYLSRRRDGTDCAVPVKGTRVHQFPISHHRGPAALPVIQVRRPSSCPNSWHITPSGEVIAARLGFRNHITFRKASPARCDDAIVRIKDRPNVAVRSKVFRCRCRHA